MLQFYPRYDLSNRSLSFRAHLSLQPNVRRGIESHLLDSSPAVRDAAVELIGKYMIDSPEVAGDYYQKIADRIAVRASASVFS